MNDLDRDVVRKAREAFDDPGRKYTSTSEGYFLAFLNELQVQLAAWQGRNFGAQQHYEMALGLAEEVGELCHAVLKHLQKIRGMEDPETFRTAAGDAAGDIFIYLCQFLTILRIDAGTLFLETARRVMKRDFTKDKTNGGEAP